MTRWHYHAIALSPSKTQEMAAQIEESREFSWEIESLGDVDVEHLELCIRDWADSEEGRVASYFQWIDPWDAPHRVILHNFQDREILIPRWEEFHETGFIFVPPDDVFDFGRDIMDTLKEAGLKAHNCGPGKFGSALFVRIMEWLQGYKDSGCAYMVTNRLLGPTIDPLEV